MPVGSVAQSAVPQPDIPAFAEEQQLAVAGLHREKVGKIGIHFVQPMGKATVDRPSVYGYILAFPGNDQMAAVVLFHFTGPVHGTEVRSVPFLFVAAGQQDCAGFKPQAGMTAQI